MKQIQLEPENLDDLKSSYDDLYRGWMGAHQNLDQVEVMLDLLGVFPGRRLLDIGCGTGYSLPAARRRGLQTYGIDLSAVGLEVARQRSEPDAELTLCSAEVLPWPTASMDYAMILGSLEHFLDPALALNEMVRVLKEDGRAAILVPNSHHIRALHNVWKNGEILSDFQEYERFATRREWERLFKASGLNVVSVHKYDTGMARVHRRGSELFWLLYNSLFRLLGNRWIPLNFTYTFIFICTPA